ncbi:Small ribosomal subunit protein bTHXc-like protein, partial [Drosera capensis]
FFFFFSLKDRNEPILILPNPASPPLCLSSSPTPPMASLLLSISPTHLQFYPLSSPAARSFAALPLRASLASSISTSFRSPSMPLIYCGRGDRKTARGKRFSHSFGNARRHKKNKGRGPPRPPVPPGPPRKDPYDDGKIIEFDEDELDPTKWEW